MKRINADYFIKLSAGIRSIRADPRPMPQWLLEYALENQQALWSQYNIAILCEL
jgi:hypothetical protein